MVKKKTESDEPDDLITQKDAAFLTGRTLFAVNDLVRRGRIRSYNRFGRTLVSRAEVLTFEPAKAGRPPKIAKKDSKK